MKRLILVCLLLVSATIHAQEIIDVGVRGISDQTRDGAQQDRLEAILDAKRQACERAGLKIESATTVENFQTVYDYVETQAESILLPGFQIIDNGYGEDGTYSVVLVGKIQSVIAEESVESAYLNLIVWFYEKDESLDQAYQLFDELYEWLQSANGEFMLDDKPLQSLEDHLVEVSKSDSLFGQQRYYAFKYQLPAGTMKYIQRTTNSSNDKIQRIRLRENMSYLFSVAAWNAVYFENPTAFTGSVSNPRYYGNYPADFEVVYRRP